MRAEIKPCSRSEEGEAQNSRSGNFISLIGSSQAPPQSICFLNTVGMS
jgi:hypothetical protein